MAQIFFNRRLMHVIVVLAHLLVVSLFAFFALSFDEDTINRIKDIVSTQTNYHAVGLEWIGTWRSISNFIVFICSLLIGFKLCHLGMKRKQDISRFFIVSLGVQILFGAGFMLSNTGLVLFGGFWHIFTVFFVGLQATSFLVLSAIMLTNWKTFEVLSDLQDQAVPEIIDTDLLEK